MKVPPHTYLILVNLNQIILKSFRLFFLFKKYILQIHVIFECSDGRCLTPFYFCVSASSRQEGKAKFDPKFVWIIYWQRIKKRDNRTSIWLCPPSWFTPHDFLPINNCLHFAGFFRFWLAPIGKSLGIKSSRPKRAANIPDLEEAYSQCSRIKHKTVRKICSFFVFYWFYWVFLWNFL